MVLHIEGMGLFRHHHMMSEDYFCMSMLVASIPAWVNMNIDTSHV